MTEQYDGKLDGYLSFNAAIAALRLAAVVRGEAVPREDEPVPLDLLRVMGAWDSHDGDAT